MQNNSIKDQIQKLKQQVADLKNLKKAQVDEIDQKIHRIHGQILNYEKTIDKKQQNV